MSKELEDDIVEITPEDIVEANRKIDDKGRRIKDKKEEAEDDQQGTDDQNVEEKNEPVIEEEKKDDTVKDKNVADTVNGDKKKTDDEVAKPSKTRGAVLRKRMVEAYLQKANDKQAKATDSKLIAKPPSKGQKAMAKIGKGLKYADTAVDVSNIFITGLSTGISEGSGIYSEVTGKKDDDVTQKLDKASGVMDATNALKNSVSLFSKSSKSVMAGIGAATTKNKRKRATGWMNSASSAMGAMSALSSLGKNGIGMAKSFGGVKLKDSDTGEKTGVGKANTALGVLGSAFGLLGAIGGMASSVTNSKMYKHYAKKAGAFSNRPEDVRTLDSTKYQLNNLRSLDLTDADQDRKDRVAKQIADQKQARRDAKAHKYAMGQAEKFNELKSKESYKGMGALVSAAIGAGVTGGGLLLGNKTWWKLGVSPLLSAAAPVIKTMGMAHEKLSERKEKKKNTELRADTVKHYVNLKKEKVRSEFEKMKADQDMDAEDKLLLKDENDEFMSLSDNMVEKIVYARLGVNVDLESDEKPGGDAVEAAFKAITMKRAKNIMLATDKEAMLSALGLDKTADINDVAQALMGE